MRIVNISLDATDYNEKEVVYETSNLEDLTDKQVQRTREILMDVTRKLWQIQQDRSPVAGKNGNRGK